MVDEAVNEGMGYLFLSPSWTWWGLGQSPSDIQACLLQLA